MIMSSKINVAMSIHKTKSDFLSNKIPLTNAILYHKFYDGWRYGRIKSYVQRCGVTVDIRGQARVRENGPDNAILLSCAFPRALGRDLSYSRPRLIISSHSWMVGIAFSTSNLMFSSSYSRPRMRDRKLAANVHRM